MKLGLCLPQFGPTADGGLVASVARRAEEVGYDSLWVGDRLLTPEIPQDYYPVGGTEENPYPPEFTAALDPILTLTAAAAATGRVRLASSTLIAPWHNAVLLGRALTTLDNISGGRLDVGFGTSWMRDEYEAAGVPFEQRGPRLDELLDVLAQLWTENPAEHHGRFFELPRARVDLRPVQVGGPALLLGGFSPAAMARVGARAAGWIGLAGMPEEAEMGLWEMALAATRAAGRDPDSLRREMRLNPHGDESVAEIAEMVREVERRGADGVHVDFSYTVESASGLLARAEELVDLLRD